MSYVICVKDKVLGKSIEMSVEPDTKVEDILVNSADYLGKRPGVYMIKFGSKILPGDMTVSEAGVKRCDLLEILPDPQGG